MEVEELKKMMEEVQGMGEKVEAKVNYYDTKLHTIIVAYFVWERVFFFGISKKTFPSTISTLSCNGNWWVILALSCSCSFVYVLLFFDAALMLYRHENQLHLILQKHAQLCRHLLAIKEEQADTKASLMEAGDQASHGLSLEEELMLINSTSPFRRRRPWERKVHVYTIFCAFIGVASLELYACKAVLCP
ncbi:hypothetical protein SDJN03_23800, partial [Cucurbita argyrosperma subsp. sororia]